LTDDAETGRRDAAARNSREDGVAPRALDRANAETPARGGGFVLLALTAAAVGISFVPGALLGLILARTLGWGAQGAIRLTAATVVVVGAGAISFAVWIAGKVTGVDRRGRRFAWTLAAGEAGLVVGVLVAAIAKGLGPTAMVMLAGLGAVLGDSMFMKRMHR